MRKSNLILGTLAGLLILNLASLNGRNNALELELAANREQCGQQLDRLRGDFQAEIDDLRSYLQREYNVGVTAAPAAEPGPRQQPVSPGDGDTEQADTVDRKYGYMYDLWDQRDTVTEMLRQLLQEREQLAPGGIANTEQIAAIEAQIGELLGVDGYQTYQMLKDSDTEQHHLREYAASMGERAPSSEQNRSLLFAKLRHKQQFRLALHGAGFYYQPLSARNREQLRRAVSGALHEYKNNYLQEVRPLLSAEQYTKLEAYENTEFSWELDRLYKQIDAKTK